MTEQTNRPIGQQRHRDKVNRARDDAGSAVYRSDELCWKCRGPLVELRPPLDSWRYYCPACTHLTLTEIEAASSLERLQPGQLGAVVSVTRRLRIEPLR